MKKGIEENKRRKREISSDAKFGGGSIVKKYGDRRDKWISQSLFKDGGTQ